VYGVYNENQEDDIYTDSDNNWTLMINGVQPPVYGRKKAYSAYKNVFDRDGHDE
jgi:hypothetical protein